MEISVIIPAHKPGYYIWECLDSLRAQTLPKDKFEVIIVLNGTREPFFGQLEEYTARHANAVNIRLLHTETCGVSNARNIGLDNAKGRFIAFIDDDDIVSPSYLEELYARSDDRTIVISNTYDFKDEEPESPIETRPAQLHGMLAPKGRTDLREARRFFFTVWMKLIPAAVIAGRRFDTSFAIGEDSIFMFEISDRIRFTDFTASDAIYRHRLRSNSAMGRQSGKSRWSRIRNDLRMIAAYTRIYLCGIRRYSFFFYLTRIRGSIHL